MLRLSTAVAALVAPLVLAGCASASGGGGEPSSPRGRASAVETTPAPRRTLPAAPSESGRTTEPEPDLASDGRPRRARLTIPAIGVRGLVVEPYRGRPDDAPGTRLQDTGIAASPHGPRGGVGPGGVGNHLVTAHRTSSTRAFEDLPSLRRGDRVHLEAGGVRYTYEIVRTRWTSFRSPASLERQTAAVPGRPGRTPTRAMVTLSTCATPEDHARGNYWSDEFGNPEHRIDKIGVLVAARPGA